MSRMGDAGAIGQRGDPAAFAGGFCCIEVIDRTFPLQPATKRSRVAGKKQFFASTSEQTSKDFWSFAECHGASHVTSRQADR